MESDNQEICLHIDEQVFPVKKNVICEHSDYFRAMFSGNFSEQEKHDIVIAIDVVDAPTMNIILRYMDLGLIDLSEYTIPVIGKLAMASNFLQITELIKQIQYCLEIQISISNWVDILTIAENAAYTELEQQAATFGLLSFKDMKPQYIPTLPRLFWYLSHPALNTNVEADVFRFGMNWVFNPNRSDYCGLADILLLIVGCLDVNKLTIQDLKEISLLMKDSENSFATEVVECLKMLLDDKLQIHLSILVWYRKELCATFSTSVYNEVYHIIRETTTRKLVFTPLVPIWTLNEGKMEVAPHYMYKYSNAVGFEKWLEVAEKNVWGWNITNWGPLRLVVVGGEHGRGTGKFMRDIRVYDALKKKWTHHGVTLPPRRHPGVTVCGDSLFIIGGIGGFRVTEKSAVVYDLKQRTHRNVVNFPEAIQSPAVCTHYDTVYAAGHKDIYKYEDLGETDQWVKVLTTQIRPNRMVSFGDFIYCTQSYFSQLYRFRPGIDTSLQLVTQFTAPPVAFSNLGDRLLVFTRTMCGHQAEQLRVEEFRGPCKCEQAPCTPGDRLGCGPEVIMLDKTPNITVNDVAGGCALVMDKIRLRYRLSEYHRRLVSMYGYVTYDK